MVNRNQNKSMSANDIIKLGGAAIGATIVVFFGWKAYKKITDKVASNKEGNEFKKELNQGNVQLSDLQLKNIAETAVYNVLSKLTTKDDWLKLNIIFGSRKRKANWPYSDMQGGLIDWLYDAMNSYHEIPKVNKILSKINVTI